MATYKVIQDIEAEDKLLGPLSFRQFLYFLAASFLGFLNFTSLTKGAWPVLLILGPPMLFCLFFAWPWSPDQPTEVWALARIRYYFKPRKRLWNQSGVKEFVTITVPKKIEKIYTDGLSQDQVRSRLEALTQTIDSRGWAVKNAVHSTDRLITPAAAPLEVSDVHDADDILDERNNPAAYQMSQMIDESSRAHRKAVIDRMNAPSSAAVTPAPAANWFQRKTDSQAPIAAVPITAPAAAVALPDVPAPIVTPRKIAKPTVAVVAPVTAPVQPAAPVKSTPDPAILNLAHDNNMDVATLAREAKRAKAGDLNDDEVVVSLH